MAHPDIQHDTGIHAQLSYGFQHLFKGVHLHHVAGDNQGTGIDQGIIGGTVGVLKLKQGVEGITGGLHTYILEHNIRTVDFQGNGKADNFGDALDAEALVGVTNGDLLTVFGVCTDAQTAGIGLPQLGNIGCYMTSAGLRLCDFKGFFNDLSKHDRVSSFHLWS